MKVILSCGGTGGHIYPAIAIADKIKEKEPDSEILFIGTKRGMENRLVPNAGYEIIGVDASGLDRHNLLNNFKTAADAVKGSKEAHDIIKKFAPDVAIGTGGYVTGPVIFQAKKLGIPCFIHEQNAIPGVANKMLEHFVNKVFISFEASAKDFKNQSKILLTGNPVRDLFQRLDEEECKKSLGISNNEKQVLVFGGSLGAARINDCALAFAKELSLRTDLKNIRLCFVSGNRYYDDVKKSCEKEGIDLTDVRIKLIPYANNMPELMKASTLVVGRAGAIAVSEIMASKKPSILIPSPNVTNNHQYKNAKAIEDAGACVMIEEKELESGLDLFSKTVFDILNDTGKIDSMCKSAESLAKLNAADLIYEELKKYS